MFIHICVCGPLLLAVGINNTHEAFINTLMYSVSKQKHVPSCLCDVDQRAKPTLVPSSNKCSQRPLSGVRYVRLCELAVH